MKVKTLGTWKVGKGKGKPSDVIPPNKIVDHKDLGIRASDVERYVKMGVLDDGSGSVELAVSATSPSPEVAEELAEAKATNDAQQAQIDELKAELARLKPAQ